MTGADSPVIGRFVHRGDALDNLTVARNDLPSLDHHTVTHPQNGRGDLFNGAIRR